MKKYLLTAVTLALVVAVALPSVTSGVVWGKGHVAAGKVQVSHKGRTAIIVDAPALNAHLKHGDIQLPACDLDERSVAASHTRTVPSLLAVRTRLSSWLQAA